MKRGLIVLFMFLLVIGLGVTGTIAQDDDGDALPSFDALTPGEWNQIFPGDDTICLYDTEYSFFVRPAETPTDNLMIFFEGGGACWDAFTCGAVGQFAARYDVPNDLMNTYQDGMFDFENEANPVGGFNTVFVPYCTGDVFMGNTAVDYTDALTGYHNGFANASAVLEWTYENLPSPEEVLVTGCSAGGYGATFHASYVMNAYPDSEVVHVADAANGVTQPAWEAFATWDVIPSMPEFIPDLAALTLDTFNNTVYTIGMVNAFPDNQFAQVNTFYDEVQVGFWGLSVGRIPTDEESGLALANDWSIELQANLGMIEDEITDDNFATFTAGGTTHCYTPREQFYTVEVEDITLAEWYAQLLYDNVGEDVSCDVEAGECILPSPGDDA